MGAALADYLLRTAENDNVQVFGIRGTSQPNNLRRSLIEMSITSELTKSRKGLYHVQLNPKPGEDLSMTFERWNLAAQLLEDQLGLTGQKRVMVMHTKHSRIHMHVVWERYDHEEGKMRSDSHSWRKHDKAREKIELALSQERTPHRNKRAPEIKKALTQLWKETKTGKDFIRQALANGYIIAKGGQRRSFLVIDDTGRSYDLTRQLEKTRVKEVRERLGSETLPMDKIVIAGIRSRQSLDAKQSAAIAVTTKFRDKQEQKKKLYEALKEASEITQEKSDPGLTASQQKAGNMKRLFKERNETEHKRDKLRKQFKEQFNKGETKTNRNGLDL